MAQIKMFRDGDSVSAGQTEYIRNHHTYKWDDDWDQNAGWDFEQDTFANRLGNFADLLYNNVGSMLNSYDTVDSKGNRTIIHGIKTKRDKTKEDAINRYREAYSQLNTFLSGLDRATGTYNGEKVNSNTLKTLANIAKEVGVDSSRFKEYFGSYLPKESPKNANRQSLEATRGLSVINAADLGYNNDVSDFLTRSKVNLMRDADNNIYALNEDYSQLVPVNYLNNDWRLRGKDGSSYNYGIFTDPETGKIWYGDISKLTTEDPFYNIVNQHKNDQLAARKNLFSVYSNFNPNLAYTEDSQLISRLKNSEARVALNNFADVSQLFRGNTQVIAVKADGTPFSEEGDEDANILSNNLIFYYIGSDNKLHQGRFDDVRRNVGEYNPNGWNEEEDQIGRQLKNLKINGTTDITADKDMSGLGWFRRMFYDGPKGSIADNKQQWAETMLNILAQPISKRTSKDIKLLDRFKGIENPDNILLFIQDMIENKQISVTPNMERNWIKVMLESADRRSKTLSEKEGGILFAKKGQIMDIYGNMIDYEGAKKIVTDSDQERQDLVNKAEEAGYSDVSQYVDNQRKAFKEEPTATDWARLGLIGADLASMVTAFVPGWGTAASAVLGFGSSLGTLGTDIAEDGFQWRDLGNLGTNLALDVAGLFGGVAKGGKILKNVKNILVKFGPLALGIWSAKQNGQDYIDVYNKVQSGKDLTVQDWTTLAQGMAILAGTSRAATSAWRQGRMMKTARQKIAAGKTPAAEPTQAPKENKKLKEKVKDAKEKTKGWWNRVTNDDITNEEIYEALKDTKYNRSKFGLATDLDRLVGNTTFLGFRKGDGSSIKGSEPSAPKKTANTSKTTPSNVIEPTVVPVRDRVKYQQFVEALRTANPNWKTALQNKQFMILSKQQYGFKQGGSIDARFGEYLKSHE